MTAQFVDVTEIEGQRISAEQLFRTCHRYHWAAHLCEGKDVLEVACGSGPGIGLLAQRARSVVAGDVSPEVLGRARNTYGARFPLSIFSADSLPFDDGQFDVVLIFEALYYLPDIGRFLLEARRVMRPGGALLIVTANKDLSDFTASPYSTRYLGAKELATELADAGFATQISGLTDISTVSIRQRALRPIKSVASKLGLIPKTMRGKELLKKLFFGEMTVMPADISSIKFDYFDPTPVSGEAPDIRHKVIYCEARRG
jgi:ubiquinone/menaquinone biosynthesis C-methylase UbiE